MPITQSFARLAALSLALTAPVAATAQDADEAFILQLNNAQANGENVCRLTMVATNGSETGLGAVAFEIYLFDGEGAVSRRLNLDFGEFIPGKTKILQFDLSDTPCADISRILVNNATSCTDDAGGESALCIGGLNASSRTPIQFGI